MKLAFWIKEKHERAKVDTIHPVLKSKKKIYSHRKMPASQRAFRVLAIFFLFILAFNFSFLGTLGALALKEKADVLQLFRQGRYLVVFQNNDEARPTGGFIGSFAIVSFRNFQIDQIDFNTNIYKMDNAFSQTHFIAPPEPLANVSAGHWTLRDANFNPDFSQSAKTLQWFYSEESGQTVDGVIAINASLIQDLLRLTGPVSLPKYETTITADNFFNELASKIEKEYFQESSNQIVNEPKTILKDLMPVLFEKAIALPKSELVQLIATEVGQKQILLQSNDPTIEQAILENNWGGAIEPTQSDYLSINNANITDLNVNPKAGAKTSLKVKESVDYSVNNTRGALIADLALTRSHTGTYIWPDGDNMNWTRVLVPLGSVLQSAELNGKDVLGEIEVGETSGKTYFGLWINTAPQTSNVLNISYSLPFSLGPKGNYSLLVQKQPGNIGDDLTATLDNKVLYNGFFNKDLTIRN